eukprot:3116857-Prymnesium_polylepis.1
MMGRVAAETRGRDLRSIAQHARDVRTERKETVKVVTVPEKVGEKEASAVSMMQGLWVNVHTPFT